MFNGRGGTLANDIQITMRVKSMFNGDGWDGTHANGVHIIIQMQCIQQGSVMYAIGGSCHYREVSDPAVSLTVYIFSFFVATTGPRPDASYRLSLQYCRGRKDILRLEKVGTV